MTGQQAVKRPHYLPAVYLRAWADRDGQVAVRRRGSARAYPAALVNVGVKRYLYEGGRDGQIRDALFQKLEDEWPTLRAKLLSPGSLLSRDERHQIAIFAALQIVRTPASFERVEFVSKIAKLAPGRPVTRDAVRRYLEDDLLGAAATENEVEAAWSLAAPMIQVGGLPSRSDAIRILLTNALQNHAPRLSAMEWVVEVCRQPILFTSDRAVMFWRRPTYRDAFEGVGLDTCEQVRFPLSPTGMLVFRNKVGDLTWRHVEPKRFHRVNQCIAAQCFHYVVAGRRSIAPLSRLQLAERLPYLRFAIGPVLNAPDDTEAVQQWIPVRAM